MRPDEDLRCLLELPEEACILLETLLLLVPVSGFFLSPTAFVLVVECRNLP
jgi:hypothetical protein